MSRRGPALRLRAAGAPDRTQAILGEATGLAQQTPLFALRQWSAFLDTLANRERKRLYAVAWSLSEPVRHALGFDSRCVARPTTSAHRRARRED